MGDPRQVLLGSPRSDPAQPTNGNSQGMEDGAPKAPEVAARGDRRASAIAG